MAFARAAVTIPIEIYLYHTALNTKWQEKIQMHILLILLYETAKLGIQYHEILPNFKLALYFSVLIR